MCCAWMFGRCSNLWMNRVWMKGLTWTRQSHGLFDYESSSIKKKDLKLSASRQIVRVEDTMKDIDIDEEIVEDEATTHLFTLTEDNSK